ncbi:helix-turn-helix domain-containing protein [Acidiferrobacter sp. SPIII_3]|uniref:helix-turn-helix domain-containing protein n=1 Tax=Acidiferrobacter sp. SPIII_3 TaxID=1281578 RepID=UPI00197A8023
MRRFAREKWRKRGRHELKQDDLADCAPQGRISDILNGRRAISKDIARKLARRFHVSPALFV